MTLLAAYEPIPAALLPLVACFSMYPLLERDGLASPYVATIIIYAALMWEFLLDAIKDADRSYKASPWVLAWRRLGRTSIIMLVAMTAIMHAARVLIVPPAEYPWLHDRAFITLAFAILGVAFLHLLHRQFEESSSETDKNDAVLHSRNRTKKHT